MVLTRFLKVCGYFLAALFVFGVATQISRFGRPLGQQPAITAQKKEFSDILGNSQASPSEAQKLGALYSQSLDQYGRLLTRAGEYMAVATTALVGLLSVTTLLWHRVRVLRTLVSGTAGSNDCSPPKGGPTEPLGNSGARGRPKSVS